MEDHASAGGQNPILIWRTSVSLLRRGFDLQRDGFRVGDVHQVADLNFLEIFWIACLDRAGITLRPLERYRAVGKIDGFDRRGERDAPCHGPTWLFALCRAARSGFLRDTGHRLV